MDIRVQFGRALRALRLKKGFSQEELAARAGLAVPYLSRLENGRNNPSLALMADLSRVLRVSLSELLSGVKPERATKPSRKRSTKS